MAGSIKVAGIPVRARLVTSSSWKTTMQDRDEQTAFHTERREKGELLASSAWIVRDEFLNITIPQQALSFFQRYGPLIRASEVGVRLALQEHCEITMREVGRHQEWLIDFIEAKSPDWLEARDLSLAMAFNLYKSPTFTLEMGFAPVRGKKMPSPFLASDSFDAWQAVYAATYIDKMRGLRGAVCQRDGCTKTFIAGDPRKRFCSDSCGANVRVTAARKRERGDHVEA